MSAPIQKLQLTELTSTRFIAAMAVLLGHFAALLALPPFVSQLISGGIGVSFFFVLSGFILCYRYWDTFANGISTDTFRRYFVMRIARVYPLYVLALLLMTGLYMAATALRPDTIRFPQSMIVSWLVNLFALQTFAPTQMTQQFWNAPGWSISTEFAFYLLLPFVLAGIARYIRDTGGLVLLLLLAIALGAFAQASTLMLVFGFGWDRAFWLDTIASRNIFWRFPEFMTGVITARLLFGRRLLWLESSKARNLLLTGCIASVFLFNMMPWPAEDHAFVAMRQFRLDLGYMIPFAGIIAALAAGPTFLSPILQRPFSVMLGETSYALYIFHWIPWTALTFLKATGIAIHPMATVGAILFTILCSFGSYLWFEKPVRSYLRRKYGQ